MPSDPSHHVVLLAPMPLELDAIVDVFGLEPAVGPPEVPRTGRVGGTDVTAVHIGMGPAAAREATARVLDDSASGHSPVHHVMVVGVCGGLDPDIPVGAMVNPTEVVEYSSGAAYPHTPPGDAPVAGRLVTTEGVTLDDGESLRLAAEGFLGVDMETSGVAEVCQARGYAWSAYRCISDRHVDGLLDPRIVALVEPDGSPYIDGVARLLAEEPDLAANLDQLAADATRAARLAAEAALAACRVLDAGGGPASR